LREHLRHKIGFAPSLTYSKSDREFSIAAAKRAAATRSNLFLYSSYALEAFTSHYHHTPHRVLFQYHPHSAFEKSILSTDNVRYPEIGESYWGNNETRLSGRADYREQECWKHADLIFCASTFTRNSLIEAGANERRCLVVPYGTEGTEVEELQPTESFKVLFVGSGGQRKGLHHLLLAWQRASLPPASQLTLICRVLDHGIERLAAKIPRIVIQRGVSARELRKAFASSTLFAMPSLVEGFGQVYLEALAHGCPVLGTPNTCLPDLGAERDGIYLASPGDVDELTAKIESLAKVLPGNDSIRTASRICASRFTWKRFRAAVCDNLLD